MLKVISVSIYEHSRQIILRVTLRNYRSENYNGILTVCSAIKIKFINLLRETVILTMEISFERRSDRSSTRLLINEAPKAREDSYRVAVVDL